MISRDIEKLRERDEGALGDLFKELAPTIATLAMRLDKDIDPDDVVAEVFLQLVRDPDRLADLAASGNLRSFCLRLARNVVLHHIRRARRATVLDSVYESSLSESEQGSEEFIQEMREKLSVAIAGLKESERTLITMRYAEDRSLEDIARLLGLSPAAVKVKLHRARLHLRNMLQLQAGSETK